MTHHDELPAELRAIERALGAGAAEPPVALRARAMARVDRELARKDEMPLWQYAAAVAAGLLLALNFSMTAAMSGATPRLTQRALPSAEHVQQLEELGLSPQEARRQAIAMAAGAQIIPMGRPYGGMFAEQCEIR